MHSCSYSLFLLLHRITVTFGAVIWLTKRFPFPASLEARFTCVYGIVNVSPSVVENIKMCKKSWDDEERNPFWEKHISFFWLLSFFRPWVSQSRSVMSDSLWSHALYTLWNSLGQNTGVGSLSLLQGIFPAQELNPGLPNCRQVLYSWAIRAWSFNGFKLWQMTLGWRLPTGMVEKKIGRTWVLGDQEATFLVQHY